MIRLGVVIPARNEEACIGQVVEDCLRAGSRWGKVRVVVCDNASTDATARQARLAGAEVVFELRRGYGVACLRAVNHLAEWPDLLVFVDGDGSSVPEEMSLLLEPLVSGEADLVLGVRPAGASMTLPQRMGTWLAVALINGIWKQGFRDIGPYRALTRDSFTRLGMTDRTWGWTVEMQILAVSRGLRIREVPVSWRPRAGGHSKISGSVSGVIRAGGRILWTIGRYALRYRLRRTRCPVPLLGNQSALRSVSRLECDAPSGETEL